MDRETRSPDGDGRALLTAALLLLAGVTAAAFGRVFLGQAAAARLVLVSAAAILLAAALERRHLALSVGLSLLGLATALGVLVFPRTTFWFLPTRATIESVFRALGNVGTHAQDQSAPVQAVPSLFSAAIIAVWAASFSAHALAARAGSAILGLVPHASLLAFAGVVVEDGARPAYAGIFLVGAVGVLFASGMRHLDRWGPILPRRSRPSLRFWAGPAGRRARRLGLTATVAALLVPGVLPGFGADPILDLDGGGGERISISPLVDIRPNLLRNPALELFTVDAERGAYWRLLSLDEYTGRFWRTTDVRAERGSTIEESASLPREQTAIPGRFLPQEFRVSRLGGVHLPAAFAPVAVSVPDVTFRHDPDRTTLVAGDGVPENLRYSVMSETMAPAPDELDRQFDFSGVASKYTRLPADTPPEVHQVARDITAGAETPYRQALAVQNLLLTFTYDEQAPAGHGINDLLFFLESRRGYCEQFAGTMAVLLRSLGYPARVAVGFLPGVRGKDGLWHVTTEEAHSWVEMFFPGFGWLAFEPTPTRNNPVAAPYLSGPGRSPDAPARGELAQLQDGGRAARGRLDPRLAAVERRHGRGGYTPEGFTAADERVTLWRRLLPFAPPLLLLAGALIPLAKWIRRRRALRRAETPRDLILIAYDLFESRATDLGLGRREGETRHEYQLRLRQGVRFSDGHLERLTGLADLAMYAGREPTSEEADAALEATRTLTGDIRRHAGRPRTVLGAMRPTPRE